MGFGAPGKKNWKTAFFFCTLLAHLRHVRLRNIEVKGHLEYDFHGDKKLLKEWPPTPPKKLGNKEIQLKKDVI